MNYFLLMRRIYEPRLGALRAHQFGMTTRIAYIFVLAYFLPYFAKTDATADLHRVTELYPFGVQLRYETAPDDEPLDRPAMRELLDRFRAWSAAYFP